MHFQGKPLQVGQGFISDQNQDEGIKERETVGQIVGGMQAMPQQIELIENKAEPHHRQQRCKGQPTAKRYALLGDKNRKKEKRQDSAVNIGQVS